MSVNSSGFKLKVPHPASPNLNHVLQPVDLGLWLQKLPLADSIEMGKKLVQKLKVINRLKLHPQLRVQFIEMLVTHIDRVIFILENNYIDSDAVFPLSPKNKDISLICIQLTEEMAYAYKLVIQDITLGKFSYKELKPAERSLLPSALFYAVHWLANLIYATALAYQSIPKAVWLDLHTVFAFARANELAFTTFKVRLGAKADRVEYALQDLYIQALLFAMAVPVRMRQQEMRTIYQILPHWSKNVSISAWSTSIVPTSTCFIIKLHRDKPPLHSTSTMLLKHPSKRAMLVLNTTTLVQILQEFYGDKNINNEEMSIGSATNYLSKATIQRLIKAWGSIPTKTGTIFA